MLSAEELADRRYPTDIAISNNGNYVAFVVKPMGRRGEHDVSEIWLSRDGQPAVKFTSGLAADTSPVFSPDSTRLAFLSDRHEREKQRLYLMPLDGGEATCLRIARRRSGQSDVVSGRLHLAVLITDAETDDEKKRTEEKNDPILEEQNLKYSAPLCR